MKNKIINELENQTNDTVDSDAAPGKIASIAKRYDIQQSDRLLGLLLKFDFAESVIVTCDAWKRTCGGVPRGAFIFFKIDPRAVDSRDSVYSNRIILARVTEEAATPVDNQTQQMLFQVHKIQATIDPLTHKDLQWSALKASIVGTYYDAPDRSVQFGNDVDTFFAPFAYGVFMPTESDLEFMINAFVDPQRSMQIGVLRYTETTSPIPRPPVRILIDVRDIVGASNSAQRLANFGKTRFGKSNSTKIIAAATFESGLNVAQVFFDPSGEYTYINDQDGTSLYALFHRRATRYALALRQPRTDEKDLGLPEPKPLAVNFYEFPAVGHALIASLWTSENSTTPQYWRPVLDWAPSDQAPSRKDFSAWNHHWRTLGMWWALLTRAGFETPENLVAYIDFCGPVKDELCKQMPELKTPAKGAKGFAQPVGLLAKMYQHLAVIFSAHQDDESWFPSSEGRPYFNDTEKQMLRMLDGGQTLAGASYLRPFNRYHSKYGASIFSELRDHIKDGRSVFLDLSQANEVVRNNLVDRICRDIYKLQNERFVSADGVGENFIMLHFEEAHRLFRADDKDMNSIYNLLAKEGAKLNISMLFSTQSMTTISPDLIKNTDNFFLAHLDDDREIREVARKYVFREVASDLERTQSRGFVRMYTRSHRFAIPAQIQKFSLEWHKSLRKSSTNAEPNA